MSSSEDFELFRPDNLVITEIPRGVVTAPPPTNISPVSPKKQSVSPPTMKKPLTTIQSQSLKLPKQQSLHSNERKKVIPIQAILSNLLLIYIGEGLSYIERERSFEKDQS